MTNFFLSPQFLVVAAACISVPIIIHLINRIRFKRLRWAAMEFLLKAQKKSRRRLIIEQLLLLALRCLLIGLTGLLVTRFIGCEDPRKQETVHIVLLDDTLSMNDQWKDAEGINEAFKVAKVDVIQETILKNISQSTHSERLLLIPLSKLAQDRNFPPMEYKPRASDAEASRLLVDLSKLQCSKLHVEPSQAFAKAREIAAENPKSRIFVHFISDFRKRDWTSAEAKEAQDVVVALAKDDKVKVRFIDCVHPYREAGRLGLPVSHDNLGIVDFRAGTRVAGNGMPISFSVTVANFSPRDAEVGVGIFHNRTGEDDKFVTFNERMPLKVPANGQATATFERRYFEEIKDGPAAFLQLYARLEKLDKTPWIDGLPDDNIRFVTVELREKAPILVIDGLGAEGRKENGDSFYLLPALESVAGEPYKIDFGDQISGGDARDALDNPDLAKYTAVFLLNVASLTDRQLANLENFARQGGGVGIFMGSQVDPVFYNTKLYGEGKGLLPAPLADSYFPGLGKDALKPEYTNRYQLLLRDDQFPAGEKLPVFGPVLKEPVLRDFMKHMGVKRFFPILPAEKWKTEPGVTRIIASLPNEDPIAGYVAEALAIARALPIDREKGEYREYSGPLRRHFDAIQNVISATSKATAYDLADTLQKMLNDGGQPGDGGVRLTDFWATSDPKIETLRRDVEALRLKSLYASPMVLTRNFGQGRVVSVMTTAGNKWNDWSSGSAGSFIYAPMVWEMQNYLSSPAGEGSLLVGQPLRLTVDGRKFNNRPVKAARTLFRPVPGKPAQLIPLESDVFPLKDSDAPQIKVEAKGDAKVEVKDGEGKVEKVEVKVEPVGGKKDPKDFAAQVFLFDRNLEPGVYMTKLSFANAGPATPLPSWSHVFNVDTRHEGNLSRASLEDLTSAVLRDGGGNIVLKGPTEQADELINRDPDSSQSPWFFLFFLAILVAEQALAVHLSFHLRGNELDLPAAAKT